MIDIHYICNALAAMFPETTYGNSTNGIEYQSFDWVDNAITIDQFSDAITIYDSQEYARNRKAAYDLLNQFEMQFDDQANGGTTWVDAVNEIKARYPK